VTCISCKVFVPPLPHDLADLKAWIIAEVKNIDAAMLTHVWQELEYRIDVCRTTRGAHIEHLKLSKIKFFQFFCGCEQFHYGRSFGFLVINVRNDREHETPCTLNQSSHHHCRLVPFLSLMFSIIKLSAHHRSLQVLRTVLKHSNNFGDRISIVKNSRSSCRLVVSIPGCR